MGCSGSLLGTGHAARDSSHRFLKTGGMVLVKAGEDIHVYRMDADEKTANEHGGDHKPVAIVPFSGEIKAFTCDGHLIFASIGNIVEARNLRNGMLVAAYKGHENRVTCLQVADGCLFTGSWDKTARRWSVQGGQELTKYEGHEDWVTCLQVAEGCLFTGSDDKTARRWSIQDGQELTKYEGHENRVTCLQVFNRAPWVITASADVVRVFDTSSGEQLYELRTHSPRNVSAISIDAGRLFTASNKVAVTELWWLQYAGIDYTYDVSGTPSCIDRIAQKVEARGDFMLRGSTLATVFLQLCVFAIRPEVDFGNQDLQSRIHALQDFGLSSLSSISVGWIIAMAWLCVAAFVAAVCLAETVQTWRCMYSDHMQYKILWLFTRYGCKLLADLLFLPLFSTLLLAWDCTCTADQCTLDADETVACWEGWHLAQAFVTLLVMMLYIWLGMRVLRVGGEVEHIRIDWARPWRWSSDSLMAAKGQMRRLHPLSPKPAATKVDSLVAWVGVFDSPRIFDITLLASKAVMAVFTTMLTTHVIPVSAVLVLLAIIMVLLVYVYRPYYDDGANRVTFGLTLGLAWTYLVSLMVASGFPVAPWSGAFFLVVLLGCLIGALRMPWECCPLLCAAQVSQITPHDDGDQQ